MSRFLSARAQKLTPYVAGLQPQEPGWIKLNTNENPYPPSPKVTQALQNFNLSRLRLYPPSDGGMLRQTIAENEGVDISQVFCGNGSDEVLALAFQAFFAGKTRVLTPDISYGFYPVWGEIFDVGLQIIPVREDLAINPADYTDGNGVVIANPNAPTSLALSLDEISAIARQNPNGLVLIDEAYIDFSTVNSAATLLDEFENLLIVRTFSKSHSLAGLRIGYAIANPMIIEGLMRVKDAFNSYPLDFLAQTAASAAICDRDYLDETRGKTIATRNTTSTNLHALGYHVLPSHTNFLLIQTPRAGELYQHLLNHKILARYWDKPRLNEYLRVSIGTDAEMEAFIACVKAF